MLPLLITIQTFFTDTADRLKGEQKGATAVEYGLLIAIVAVVIVGSMALLDTPIDSLVTSITTKLKVS